MSTFQHNSIDKYVPNDQSINLQNNGWVKDLFKVPDRLMDYNVTEYEK